jgi:hypothetical protein
MHGFRDYSTDELEQELRMDQMRADIRHKTKQEVTEWPKVFTGLLIPVAALMGAAGTLFGYSLRH